MTDQQTEQLQNQAELIKEEVLDLLEESGTIESAVLETSNAAVSFGKTCDQWHKDLSVPIDPSADPSKVNLYCSQLAHNLDISYRNLHKAKSIYFSYNLSYNNALNEKVASQALNKGRKVAPAIETMTKVAESQLGARATTAKRLEYTVDFWTGMVFKIKDQIGIVKTIAMSNGTRYKVGEY